MAKVKKQEEIQDPRLFGMQDELRDLFTHPIPDMPLFDRAPVYKGRTCVCDEETRSLCKKDGITPRSPDCVKS